MESVPHTVKKHLISVDDYHTMAKVGLFPEPCRVELINGEIFDMTPIGPTHGSVVKKLIKRFVLAVGDEAIVSVQDSIRMGDLSQPEPDLCLLRHQQNYYSEAIPEAKDVLLLVEVANSSLEFDSKVKARLYAAHGIVEYWLLDTINQELLIYTKPAKDGYEKVVTLLTPSEHTPKALPNVKVDLTGLFPAP